jgi:hypothetical protein
MKAAGTCVDMGVELRHLGFHVTILQRSKGEGAVAFGEFLEEASWGA